ncbi:MAG: SUMF1/EgtB/PvdO family nonheme iron enzyme [Desulfuromonas sp.]|nr:SUMF1/EgtB/PvdO family nonheme iron enzyme [Desulfuromonas sp.]
MSLIISTPDALRQSVEAASGGKNTVMYDDKGYPSVMVEIPKFNLEDIDPSLGTGVHPAFIVNGVEKKSIFIAKYQATIHDERALSLPGHDPATYVDFDTALARCKDKGAGWHLMTNAEWAAIALWCWKNGTMPRGNNNYGRDVGQKHEVGRLTQDGVVLGTSGTARTATGSGPATWSHDHTPDGISDLNGNVYEWNGGLRINDGEIQVLENNNAADSTKDQSAASALWRAIAAADGSLVDPGTAGSLKYDATGATGAGSVQIDTVIDSQSDGTTYAGGVFESMAADAGITVPERLLQLGLAPVGAGLGGDYIYARNVGERLPLRGGSWTRGTYAGVFVLYLAYERSNSDGPIGFRPAFVL